MPDTELVAPTARRKWAVAAIGAWIGSLPDARTLGPEDLRAYPSRDATAGWRLEVNFPDRPRHLDLLVVPGFPRRAPKVAIVDRPKFLTWPHVEEDGVLCLLGDN